MNKRMQKAATGRPMLRSFRPEGTYYSSATGALYLQKTPTRVRVLPVANDKGQLVYDAAGRVVKDSFPVLEPWRRVTPKITRFRGASGAARRQWSRETRVAACV